MPAEDSVLDREYVRTVVPGATYAVVVGAGGPGATSTDPYGTPGGDGAPSPFLGSLGTPLTHAGGGGTPDPLAMIGREGADGLPGLSTGGPGGVSNAGSLEPPYDLRGGHGGCHAINSAGGDGADGYAILIW